MAKFADRISTSGQHIKARTFMTSGTIGKIIRPVTAKGTRTVMAHHAVIRAAAVLARGNVGHLPPLPGPCDDRMTLGTAHAAVVSMRKYRSKNVT